MSQLTTDILLEDYQSLKLTAQKKYFQKEYEDVFKYVEIAARIAYSFNFIQSMCDEELDELLRNCSIELFTNSLKHQSQNNKVIFYDYFSWPNRGLTQQYIYGLVNLGYELLYIVPNNYSFNEENEIINFIKKTPNASFLVLDGGLSNIEKARKIISSINYFQPSIAFIHSSPWDIVASLVFVQYENIISRYFINITDHAFWLGKNLIDTNIEFRNFGYQVSKNCRNIDKSKLSILPYYPIINNKICLLEEFFEKNKNKVIGVSGGNGYKFIGDNDKFYILIETLLNKYNDFVFILIGADKFKRIYNRRIKEQGLENRFIFLNDIDYLYDFLTNCSLYIGSYPVSGALMSQLAAMAGLPIVSYNRPDFHTNDISELFPNKKGEFIIAESEEEFFSICDKLITNETFRKEYAKYTKDGVITINEFNISLGELLKGNRSKYNFLLKDLSNINDTSINFCKQFLEIENKYSGTYLANFSFITNPRELIDNQYNLINRLLAFQIKNSKLPFLKKIKQKIVNILRNSRKNILEFFFRLLLNPYKQFSEFRDNENQRNIQKNFRAFGSNGYVTFPNRIINSQFISIGDNFCSLYNFRLEAISHYMGFFFTPEIIIGSNVSINTDVHIGCINKIVIGDNVLIASKVFITDHSHGNADAESLKINPINRQLTTKGPVLIGDNVWIGEGVCILSGVSIGNNSIIGANSVVTKSFPDNVVVAGVPARIIKTN